MSPRWAGFGLVAGALVVLTRFFFMSSIAYGFYQRSCHFRTQIEKHWMHGKPTLDAIISEIDMYDHGRAMPPTARGVLRGQVVSGGAIALAVPLILLSYELYLGHSWAHCMILVGLVAYAALEAISYKSYDPMRRPPCAGGSTAVALG